MNEEPQVTQSVKRERLRWDWFVLTFSATLFCSALLMFCIQPLFGKLLLPKLGGTPQIWNTCMVFFQAMLFAGYLYAHFTGVLLGLRRQAALHIALAFAATLALPIGLSGDMAPPDTASPVMWLIQTLFVSVGLPMFVISSTAPLIQKWFSHMRHPSAEDPYFLYVASNLGSLLALLSYPTVIEPFLDLGHQASLLSAGFVSLVVALLICAFLFYQNYAPAQPIHQASAPLLVSESVTWRQQARWLLLSFVPSSLLLGVTTHISTDIAAVPLFWMAPLALYLLTFVLVFAKKPPITHKRAMNAQVYLITLVVIVSVASIFVAGWSMLILHLCAFFVTALVCHGELAQSRPGVSHLTEFYLWLSFGGVLGGAFNALLAPVIFTRPLEYPVALALACMLRPYGNSSTLREWRYDVVAPLALLVAVLIANRGLAIMLMDESSIWYPVVAQLAIMTPAALVVMNFCDRPIRFGLGVATVMIGIPLLPGLGWTGQLQEVGPAARSFFGIYKVYHDKKSDLNIFLHGTTIHGVQFRDPARASQQASYYYSDGAFGDLFRALDDKIRDRRVAIVGLGAGALSCYGGTGSDWTYYEIDPLVEEIARDPRYFTYLRDCPPKINVVIGDARLKLREAPDNHYALIIVDAFSSDSIPAHLLTREAIAGYVLKLAPDGVLALHISNRYLHLEPVVGNLARDAKLIGITNRDARGDEENRVLRSPSQLVLLASKGSNLGGLINDPRWRPLNQLQEDRVWSDDFVNILSILKVPGIVKNVGDSEK